MTKKNLYKKNLLNKNTEIIINSYRKPQNTFSWENKIYSSIFLLFSV